MAMPDSLRLDTDACTACRACELACHYHHTGQFGTSANSVHVDYRGDTSQLVIAFDDTCDSCYDEPRPLCAEFCVPGAINEWRIKNSE
jgi:Fe-S-cluster-containing dehydrogenase component